MVVMTETVSTVSVVLDIESTDIIIVGPVCDSNLNKYVVDGWTEMYKEKAMLLFWS